MVDEGCVTGEGWQQSAFKCLYVKYVPFHTVSHPKKRLS